MACDTVSTWANGVKFSLVNAAPILQAADDAQGSIGTLLNAVVQPLTELLDMVRSFSNRRYILKLITSKGFKKRFESTRDTVTELLQALQLTMQAVQLKLQADQSTAKISASEVKDAVMATMKETMSQMSVTVAVDEKFDALIAQQHEMLMLEKQQLEAQGNMDVKLDALLDNLKKIDPNLAVTKELDFQVSGTLQQVMNMADPMKQRILTHAGSITPFSTAKPLMHEAELLTEREWTWMGSMLASAFEHDFGLVDVMQVMAMGPKMQETLSPKVQDAAATVAAKLKFEDRGMKLEFRRLDAHMLGGSAEFKLIWPATGPKLKCTDLGDMVLEPVREVAIPASLLGNSLFEPQPQPAGCCTLL